MKHQYVGDVNDYIKYGLLRCLTGAGLSVGVCWMLTPEDSRTDGLKVNYLSAGSGWEQHDARLFAFLQRLVHQAHGRHLSQIEASELFPNTRFFREEVPEAIGERSEWFKHARCALGGSDLVFFDPDNGIEVRSRKFGARHSCKYAYWHELRAAWKDAASLLVFQHFPRKERGPFVSELVAKMSAELDGAAVIPLRSAHVLFLFAVQARHLTQIAQATATFSHRWAKHVQACVPQLTKNVASTLSK